LLMDLGFNRGDIWEYIREWDDVDWNLPQEEHAQKFTQWKGPKTRTHR